MQNQSLHHQHHAHHHHHDDGLWILVMAGADTLK
jgi:hypothetical protein